MSHLDFIIAGTAKGGSSLLYQLLDKHPLVQMSLHKEPSLFDMNWNIYDKMLQSEFPNKEGIMGEATVEYMVNYKSLERIKDKIPRVKLIFILRDPIKRAYSHYWHRVKMGSEKRKFEDTINNITNYTIYYGLYGQHLKQVYKLFEKNQILILFLEEFVTTYPVEYGKLLYFLDLPSFTQKLQKVNESKIYKHEHLNRIMYFIRKSQIKQVIPISIAKKIEAKYNRLYKYNWVTFEPPKLKNEIIIKLQKIFKDDLILLEKLLGKQIPWKY